MNADGLAGEAASAECDHDGFVGSDAVAVSEGGDEFVRDWKCGGVVAFAGDGEGVIDAVPVAGRAGFGDAEAEATGDDHEDGEPGRGVFEDKGVFVVGPCDGAGSGTRAARDVWREVGVGEEVDVANEGAEELEILERGVGPVCLLPPGDDGREKRGV